MKNFFRLLWTTLGVINLLLAAQYKAHGNTFDALATAVVAVVALWLAVTE